MNKTKVIVSGKIDKAGLKKVGKGFLIAMGGALATFILDLPNSYDFGMYSPIVMVLSSTAINYFYKLLSNYEVKK